ncbi:MULTISPECIES: CBS domain-containing protein [Chitinophagaceae]
MLCKQIAKTDYPTVSTKESREAVEDVLRENEIKAIPVLSDKQFKGIATQDLLHNYKENNLEDIFSGFVPECVGEDDHAFRALRLMKSQRLPIVAVLSNNKEYEGVITAADLLPVIATLLGMDDAPGGSITIEMDRNDYSFGELARLVETNDADIVQLNTYTEAGTGLFIVTLKVSREDISDIVATLQRYDYTIRYYFGQESYENELKANYDALINYLNI